MTSLAHAQPWRISFDRAAQVKGLLIALAFAGVFYNVLLDLGYVWLHESDWSHGPVIPLFSAYLVYLNWDAIRASPIRHTWVGFVLVLSSLAVYQWSLWGAESGGLAFGYVRPLSMLICLVGIIITMCGLPVMRYAWLPWLYLFFAVPLPKRMYFALTDPLRRMAATVATSVLALVPGLDIERVGSTIRYFYAGKGGMLDVADACSGMRSTITLCALGVAVTFLSPRPWWQRLLMVASCIPIATFCNFIRVTITSILHIFVDPQYARGTYHSLLGLLMLLVAFGIFSGLGWVLNQLVVEEDESPEPAARGAAG